jgi:cell division protein FtsL
MRSSGAVALMLLAALALGLGVVWCGTERYDLAYKLTAMRRDLRDRETLVGKLEVERDSLLSPHRLRAKAREFGLGPADRGHIRKMAPPQTGEPATGE